MSRLKRMLLKPLFRWALSKIFELAYEARDNNQYVHITYEGVRDLENYVRSHLGEYL